MMLPDSPQNLVVVRAPSPSVHYIPGSSMSNETSPSSHVLTSNTHQLTTVQQPVQSLTQPVSESWCLTSIKVIKVNHDSTFVMFLFSYD